MKNKKVHTLVGMALLIAIIVVFQMLAGVLPTLPGGAQISLVLIPIVLGAAVYGEIAGAILGAIFGLIAFYYSFTGLDLVGFAIFNASPVGCFVLCVLKSAVAGFLAGVLYRLISKRNGYIAMLCASIICPVVNTGIFMGSVALFFNKTTIPMDDSAVATIVSLFGTIFLCNFIPELIINIVFSPAGQRILKLEKK